MVVYRKQNYYNDITLNNLAMIATLNQTKELNAPTSGNALRISNR